LTLVHHDRTDRAVTCAPGSLGLGERLAHEALEVERRDDG
jgi:hypothetical protein